MKNKKFKLGDKVKFKSKILKFWKEVQKSTLDFDNPFVDKGQPAIHSTNYEEKALIIEQEGFICGIRNLPKGLIQEGKFKPTGYQSVYLVATNLKKKPTQVSKEHLIMYNQ